MLSLIGSKGVAKEAHSGIQADTGSAIFDTGSRSLGVLTSRGKWEKKDSGGSYVKFLWAAPASDISIFALFTGQSQLYG